MKQLLDTHVFLWFVLGDVRCKTTARAHIEDPAHEKWLSPASHWEIAIKISLGRYVLPGSFETFIQRSVDDNGFRFLPIKPAHTAFLTTMPFYHHDPFDRLLIAQAIVEGMSVVSADAKMDAYGIQRIW